MQEEALHLQRHGRIPILAQRKLSKTSLLLLEPRTVLPRTNRQPASLVRNKLHARQNPRPTHPATRRRRARKTPVPGIKTPGADPERACLSSLFLRAEIPKQTRVRNTRPERHIAIRAAIDASSAVGDRSVEEETEREEDAEGAAEGAGEGQGERGGLSAVE